MVRAVTAVELPLLQRQAYVGGAWVDADSGKTFPVVNPASGKESGIGREGSSYGIDEWLELKCWAIGGIGGPS
jgi:acyl-CoA reductase-like NAD-dependent aldehyde dehydrogenase